MVKLTKSEIFEKTIITAIDSINLRRLMAIMPDELINDFSDVLMASQRRRFFYFRGKQIPVNSIVHAGNQGSILIISTEEAQKIFTEYNPINFDELNTLIETKLGITEFAAYDTVIQTAINRKADVSSVEGKLDKEDFDQYAQVINQAVDSKVNSNIFEDFVEGVNGVLETNSLSLSDLSQSKLNSSSFYNSPLFENFDLVLRVETKSNTTGDNVTTGPVYYSSVQGSCIVGDNIILAMINTGDMPIDNKGFLREYSLSTGKLIREKQFDIFHANGMTYDPETNLLYVSHNSTFVGSTSSSNNDISLINYTSFNLVSVKTPSNLPSGRRVKCVSFDPITSKLYVGDDYGIFEIDRSFNVINQIDFGPEYLSYPRGVGQNSIVYDNTIYYLSMGPSHIAVMDIEGSLLYIRPIERLSKNGYFIGEEAQSINIVNGELYLAARYGYVTLYSDRLITYVHKTNLSKGNTSYTSFTSPLHTSKTLYVDAASKSARPDGSSKNPFNNLNEALYYSENFPVNFNISIKLSSGEYDAVEFQSSGRSLLISGTGGDCVINGFRAFQANLKLDNLTIRPRVDRYGYAFLSTSCNIHFSKVSFDGLSSKTGLYAQQGSYITCQECVCLNCDIGIRANASTVNSNTEFINCTQEFYAASISVFTGVQESSIPKSFFSPSATVLKRGVF